MGMVFKNIEYMNAQVLLEMANNITHMHSSLNRTYKFENRAIMDLWVIPEVGSGAHEE
jgi:hypothetical protein